jgi:hypothetical protein
MRIEADDRAPLHSPDSASAGPLKIEPLEYPTQPQPRKLREKQGTSFFGTVQQDGRLMACRNHLLVGQIYLDDNPALKKPLTLRTWF